MAFTTKIDLTTAKVYQGDNEPLVLSGDTTIAAVGTLKYAVSPTITGATQIPDKNYVDTCVAGSISSGTTYTLGSPAAVTVGGITPNYVLTGKSTNCILQDMLYPELCGVLTAPSMISLVLAPSTSPLEVGTVIPTLSVTANFSRGSINPQYCSASPDRSGAATCYSFTGAQINGLKACTADSDTETVTTYSVTAGANTWGGRACYAAGVQPKSNKNINFSTPLGAGIATLCENTITGIYPYYYGQITCATRPAVTNALVTGGTKVAANAGTCTSVTYSAVGQWTWFALPASCAARAYWCETDLSRGSIASAPSDKYPDTCNISISSACWAGVSYNVYMSGTVGNVNTIALSSYLIP